LTFLSLSLGVGQRPDAKGAVSKNSIPSKSQFEKTLGRDSFSCRCCGFVSKKYQRVLPMGALSSGKGGGDDFATVCSFCELTATLDRAGQTAAGYLIWLPELSQGDLNHVAHALYIARESSSPELSKAASRTLDVLTARRAEAKKRLGTDDPLIFATALLEQVDPEKHAARMARMEGLRFLPLDRYFVPVRGKETDVFPQMLAYWASAEGPYGKLPVEQWTKLFEDVTAKASA
jgi:intracellular multiplication protein IcmJ